MMDFNDETLEYTEKTLENLKTRHHRKFLIQMVKKSVNHILKESFKPSDNQQEGEYDFVYCPTF